MSLDSLLARTQENFPQADLSSIRRAYEFASLAHGDQKRKSEASPNDVALAIF